MGLMSRSMSMASLLCDSLAVDVSALLTEFLALKTTTKARLDILHKELLRKEKGVRSAFQALVKSFNSMLEHLRDPTQQASALDASVDPWLFEQKYRAALKASNWHSEKYLAELSSLDDSVILLSQKREALRIMCEKLFVFEVQRHGTEAAEALEKLGKTIAIDEELLNGAKNVEAVSAPLLEQGTTQEAPVRSASDDGDNAPSTCPPAPPPEGQKYTYPFQMPLPPPGTDFYEGDLKVAVRGESSSTRKRSTSSAVTTAASNAAAAQERVAEIAALCADESEWQGVRAILTDDRMLHLFKSGDGDGSEGGEELGPFKSICCRGPAFSLGFKSGSASEGASAVSICRATLVLGSHLGDASSAAASHSAMSCCFEVNVQSQSLLKKMSSALMSGVDMEEHYVFQAQETREMERWLKLLENQINLGDPLAVATCVDEVSGGSSGRVNDEGGAEGGDQSGAAVDEEDRRVGEEAPQATRITDDETEEKARAARKMSVAEAPLGGSELEASLDALLKNLPEDEPEFQRDSIYLQGSGSESD
jgi:hypothetical protein